MTDFTQTAQETPPSTPKTPFCTNCGNAVSEQAIACMSCGASPTGHKKFCRQCGVALNPEQIVCVKCGSAVGVAKNNIVQGFPSLSAGKPNSVVVSEVAIYAAAVLALVSFMLPWVEVAIPMVASITRNGFATYAFWFGLVFLYPMWMTLTKQNIDRVIGFACAGIGIIGGIAYPHFVIANGLGSFGKGLDMFGVPEMTRAIQEITRELTSVGVGSYIFVGACILLIVGIVLRNHAAHHLEATDLRAVGAP